MIYYKFLENSLIRKKTKKKNLWTVQIIFYQSCQTKTYQTFFRLFTDLTEVNTLFVFCPINRV